MRQRFIQSFSTSGDVQTAVDNKELGKPFVAYVEDGQYIDWNSKGIDYTSTPLTLKIMSGDTIYWKVDDQYIEPLTIMYKKNDEEWVSITSTTGGTPIDVKPGDNVLFLGNNDAYGNAYGKRNFFSGSTGTKFEAQGNIMSLIAGENFVTATTLNQLAFYLFFNNCTSLTSAEKLVLPATTLAQNCYGNMFANCTSLTTAPELPATTLAYACYGSMFKGCTSLTTAPELPATTLTYECYYAMFKDCTALTTAPELPATTLAQRCYMYMFEGCRSLTTAPELPATMLVDFCNTYMFQGCTSLNYIKCLATNISAYACTSSWVNGVSPTGTFVKDPDMNDWPSGASGIPDGWTVIDA